MAKKQSIDWNGETIHITYGNGQKFAGDCAKLPESIYRPCAAARHGIAQKLGDAKSGGTAAEKFAEVQAIWQNMLGGLWNRRAEGAGIDALMPRAYEIIAGLMGKASDVAAVWLQEYLEADETRKEEIRAKPHMKSAINQARAERALSGVDVEDEDEFDPNA